MRSLKRTVCGLTFCRRAKVRSWLVSAAPRFAADSIPERRARISRRRHISLKPGRCRNDHQKVVESWATPPVNCPSASSFWEFGELLLHAFQFEGGLAPLGDVARDLGKTDKPVVPLMASMTTLAQKNEPSLRTRQPFNFRNGPCSSAIFRARAGLPPTWSGRGVKP